MHLGDAANALSNPPGEYGRKIKTQRNSRGPAQAVEHVVNSMQREEPYLVLTYRELSRDGLVPSGTLIQVLHGCRQLVS